MCKLYKRHLSNLSRKIQKAKQTSEKQWKAIEGVWLQRRQKNGMPLAVKGNFNTENIHLHLNLIANAKQREIDNYITKHFAGFAWSILSSQCQKENRLM